MIGLEKWFGGGERIPITLSDGQQVRVFCRAVGRGGESITFIHGFPTCSWDWAAVSEGLGPEYPLLLPDLLGYGDSDKPAGHKYSLMEHADIIERLWRHFEVTDTRVVGHDIGATVVQELLAREREGHLRVRLTRVVLLNAALYHGLSRPRPLQRLMAQPAVGVLLARLTSERLFTRNLAATFAAAHPLAPEVAHQYWLALQRRSTSGNLHRLLGYIPERAKRHVRWETALEQTSVPRAFIWGMEDPVSGAPVAKRVRERLPAADFVALDGVGHFPQLEAPEPVVAALRPIL